MTLAKVQVSHHNIPSHEILVTYTNAKVDSPQTRLEPADLCIHLVSEVGVVTVEWFLVVAEDTGTHASRRASGTRRDMQASSETPPEKKTTLHLRTVGRGRLGCVGHILAAGVSHQTRAACQRTRASLRVNRTHVRRTALFSLQLFSCATRATVSNQVARRRRTNYPGKGTSKLSQTTTTAGAVAAKRNDRRQTHLPSEKHDLTQTNFNLATGRPPCPTTPRILQSLNLSVLAHSQGPAVNPPN